MSGLAGSIFRLSVWPSCHVYMGRWYSSCWSEFNHDRDLYRAVCYGGKILLRAPYVAFTLFRGGHGSHISDNRDQNGINVRQRRGMG